MRVGGEAGTKKLEHLAPDADGRDVEKQRPPSVLAFMSRINQIDQTTKQTGLNGPNGPDEPLGGEQ